MKKIIPWVIVAGLMSMPLKAGKEAPESWPVGSISTHHTITITKRNILFTIDDGPSTYMKEIANTLDSIHYQGIFYVVGRGITEKNRQDLIEVLQMWHHIWNHSFSHPNFHTLTFDQAKEEILKTDAIISSIYQEAGIPWTTKYIRYPYGNQPYEYYRQEMNVFLDSLGYEEPMFRRQDVDLRDCVAPPKDENIARMKSGDTILLHERPWTVETIQKIDKTVNNSSKK